MVILNNVSVSFGSRTVLSRINLHVKAGEFVSLIGETGAGKTTLRRLIYFDVLPDEGELYVGDYDASAITRRDIPKLRRKLGIVFQDFKLLEDRNVYENVRFALEVTGVRRDEVRKRTAAVLSDVGLSHKGKSMPSELSGGEQQRVVVARALVNHPMLILADEPTANLDSGTSDDILNLLKSINAKGTAVILASHNQDLIRKSGSRIIQIKQGRLSGAS